MPAYRCLRHDGIPETLPETLFRVTDDAGRGWICRQEEDPQVLADNLGTSEYAWGAYYTSVAGTFAQGIGLQGSDWDVLGPMINRTVVASAEGPAALAGVLAALQPASR